MAQSTWYLTVSVVTEEEGEVEGWVEEAEIPPNCGGGQEEQEQG